MIIVSECSEGFGSEEYREANAKLVELGGAAWLDSILPKKRERRIRAELTSLSLQSQALASRISCLVKFNTPCLSSFLLCACANAIR